MSVESKRTTPSPKTLLEREARPKRKKQRRTASIKIPS